MTSCNPAALGDDPLTDRSPPGVLWTRVNTAEALPGVVTAMDWSFNAKLSETNVRRSLADLGVIPRSATAYPQAAGERFVGVFHGRLAMNVDVFRRLYMGLPGVTGDEIERDILGSVREGVHDKSYGWRLPAVAVKAPAGLVLNSRRSETLRRDVGRWWSARVGAAAESVDAHTLLREAVDRWSQALWLHGRTRLIYQGACSQLSALAERAGDPSLASRLLAGELEETVVAEDLWRLAHGKTTLDEFLARHGYMSARAHNLNSRSWREDPGLIRRIVEEGVVEDPSTRRRRATIEAQRATETLLRGLPAPRRPAARALLRVTPSTTRTLERTKATFMMILDAARAAVRRLGADLAHAGRIEDPDDLFLLFIEEALDLPADLPSLIAARRAQHAKHALVTLPETWTGQPDPVLPHAAVDSDVRALQGTGVSAGVVEGRARVILDLDTRCDIESGDILVCPVTDPGWVPVMMLAGGLVIDIGGPGSHGAIVARELGVPCVIGTHSGTTVIRDGDLVRLDGTAGTVQVIKRSAP